MAASRPILQEWRRSPDYDKQLQRRWNLQARFRIHLGENVVPLRLVALDAFDPAPSCVSRSTRTAQPLFPPPAAWKHTQAICHSLRGASVSNLTALSNS